MIDNEKTGFLVPPGDTDGFVQRLEQLRDTKFRENMGKTARKEAERWGWEAATSQLRNVQYEKALMNHHSRAFGGFGRPGTAGVWRLLGWRISRVMQKIGVTLKPRTRFGAVWKRFFRSRPTLADV